MALFCVNCGATMTGAFCNKCGARAVPSGGPGQVVAQTPAPPQAPTVPAPPPAFQPVAVPAAQAPIQAAGQPVAAAAKGSSLGKILAIVGGVLLLLFVLAVGAGIYGVYWVKHKVSNYAAAVKGGSSEPIRVVANGNSCKLLSTADLQQVLGVTIEKSAEIMEGDKPGCAYYTNQQAFSQLQRQAMAEAKRQADEVNSRPGPKPDNLPALMKNANNLEGVVKGLAMTQPVQDGQVFSFTVERGGDSEAWAGARLVQSVVPGFEEVQGVGDRAMIGSFGHAFYVQKGDVIITMVTTWIPDTRTRGVELGKKIIGNL